MNENRSFFWPLTLIATGVLWLLVSMERIPAANLWALTHIWPYVLILLGIGLILRSFWKPFGKMVSALVVIGAVAAVVFAPQLGWADAPAWGWNIGDNDFGGAIKGSGVMKTQTREASKFDAIAVHYPAEIVVKQGETESVRIEAEDNLLPQLATEVRSGTLYIENKEDNFARRVNPTEVVKITVTVKTLNDIAFASAGKLTVDGLVGGSLNITLSGAGDIILKNLDLRSLDARLSGAGKFTAEGFVNRLTLTISGLGDFRGAELTCEQADVIISGAGNATLRVEDELTARVSGAGSVNYYGSPKVTESISGAGDVNKLDD